MKLSTQSTLTRFKLALLLSGLIALSALFIGIRDAAAAPLKHLLVVTYTTGFRHGDSIAVAEDIIKMLGEESGQFDVDYARTADDVKQKMTADALKNYDAVFFCQTTGDLGLPDRQAFLDYIKAGHGFIGTHSATDTYHDWPEYLQMIGAEFMTHGRQVEVTVHNEDPKHPAAEWLPNSFKVFDEIYEFKPKSFSRTQSHVILAMTEHPQTKEPGDYWTAWSRCYGQGKVFYTALGHRPDVWKQPWYQQHILGGIRYVLGLEAGSCEPSSPAPVNPNAPPPPPPALR